MPDVQQLFSLNEMEIEWKLKLKWKRNWEQFSVGVKIENQMPDAQQLFILIEAKKPKELVERECCK